MGKKVYGVLNIVDAGSVEVTLSLDTAIIEISNLLIGKKIGSSVTIQFDDTDDLYEFIDSCINEESNKSVHYVAVLNGSSLDETNSFGMIHHSKSSSAIEVRIDDLNVILTRISIESLVDQLDDSGIAASNKGDNGNIKRYKCFQDRYAKYIESDDDILNNWLNESDDTEEDLDIPYEDVRFAPFKSADELGIL